DEINGSETQGEMIFHVRGHEVEPSDTLVARNFQFLRSENDSVGLTNATYHQGDMVWARFDVTGYQFTDHKFSMDYGIAVETADGKQMFAQPVAAEESGDAFYPQRWVPGMFSISLDKNVPTATYTLILTMRDKIANRTAEQRATFKVE